MIAITGAAGFIGSAIVWEFNRRGFDDILIVDALQSDERWKNLRNLKFLDIIHKDDFPEMLEDKESAHKIDGIIHMGACTDTTETDAEFLLSNNYEYTQALCFWCIANKKRFVYASSAATYGAGEHSFSDEHDNIPNLRPLNMYGYSKQLFDYFAMRNGLLDKIVGLKYFNVFGPNEYHKGDMRSVVHKAFGQIASTGKVRLFKSYRAEYKDGWQLRDFIYVKDAVDMTLWAYENGNVNGIFNVGTGKARSFYDLVAAVFSAMGKKPQIEYVEMPEEIRAKYQYFTQAEIMKLRRAGYARETMSLENGIEDYVKNYLLQDDAYLCN